MNKTKVSIWMPDAILKIVEEICDELDMKPADWIRQRIYEYLEAHGFIPEYLKSQINL